MSACGTFVRYRMRDGKGPRGGRAQWVIGTCVDCGRESDPVKLKRPGSIASEERETARAHLAQHSCASPRPVPDADVFLLDLAEHVRRGERLPVSFAVRHRIGGARSLDAAAREAWATSQSGYAMGALWMAGYPDEWGRRTEPYRSDSGDRVMVTVRRPTFSAVLSGDDREVATALRGMVPAERLSELWAPVTEAMQRGAA